MTKVVLCLFLFLFYVSLTCLRVPQVEYHWYRAWSVNFTTHFHLTPRKNDWNYTSTPLYAFIAWAGRTLAFHFYLFTQALHKLAPVHIYTSDPSRTNLQKFSPILRHHSMSILSSITDVNKGYLCGVIHKNAPYLTQYNHTIVTPTCFGTQRHRQGV